MSIDVANDDLSLEKEKETIIKDFMTKNPNLYELYELVLRAIAAVPLQWQR